MCVCVCVWGGRGRPWQGVRGEIAAVDGCLQLWCTYNLHMKRNKGVGELGRDILRMSISVEEGYMNRRGTESSNQGKLTHQDLA